MSPAEGRNVLDSEIGFRAPVKNGNGKTKKKRFGILDILIILMVAAAVGMAVYAYYPGLISRLAGGTGITVEYDLLLEKQNKGYLSAISAGDGITAEKGGSMGTVVSTSASPSLIYSVRDGEAYADEDPSLVDIVITVRAEVVDTGSGLVSDGVRIAAGSRCGIILPKLVGDAVIVSVRTVGE